MKSIFRVFLPAHIPSNIRSFGRVFKRHCGSTTYYILLHSVGLFLFRGFSKQLTGYIKDLSHSNPKCKVDPVKTI